jgi:TrpR-related protein YerC/YecD
MRQAKQAAPEELERLYTAFAGCASAAEVAALMEDLCTIREVNEMAQRLSVAVMLAGERSYNDIQASTGASATTIARVSKSLNYGAGGYRRALEQTKDQPESKPTIPGI